MTPGRSDARTACAKGGLLNPLRLFNGLPICHCPRARQKDTRDASKTVSTMLRATADLIHGWTQEYAMLRRRITSIWEQGLPQPIEFGRITSAMTHMEETLAHYEALIGKLNHHGLFLVVSEPAAPTSKAVVPSLSQPSCSSVPLSKGPPFSRTGSSRRTGSWPGRRARADNRLSFRLW
jgi:hypothetical protein